jgi:hypothetical protein
VVVRVKHYLAIPALLKESNLIFTVRSAIAMSLSSIADIKVLELPFAVPRPDVKQPWHARFRADPANRWMRGVVAELLLERWRRASPARAHP